MQSPLEQTGTIDAANSSVPASTRETETGLASDSASTTAQHERNSPDYSRIFDDLVERAGLTNPWVAVTVGAALLALRVLAMWLDGLQGYFSHLDFWQHILEQPLLIAYLLLAHRLQDRHGRKAIESCRPLLAESDEQLNRFLTRVSRPILRRQWLAIAVAVLAGVPLSRMWDWPSGFWWNVLAVDVSTVILYALIGSFIYLALYRTWVFAQLYQGSLRIDIFDLSPLRPMAGWGLGMSVGIIGGVTISALALGDPEELLRFEQLLIYSIVLAAAILLFFGSLLSAHHAIVRAKAQELRVVQENLSSMYVELKERTSAGHSHGMDQLSGSINAWLAYERRIREVQEWPYTVGTLGSLFGSLLVPVGLTTLQQLLLVR